VQNSAKISTGILLKKKDVTALLRISMRTLDYRIRDGSIPYIKVGGAVRFLPRDIDNLIASRRIGQIEGGAK
jgi:hypothetical protein